MEYHLSTSQVSDAVLIKLINASQEQADDIIRSSVSEKISFKLLHSLGSEAQDLGLEMKQY